MNKSVMKLRQEGYKVQVHYERMFRSHDRWGIVRDAFFLTPYSPRHGFLRGETWVGKEGIWPRGGRCSVTVTTPDGKVLSGVSECSIKDNFDRKRGLAIALGRAFKHDTAGD